MTNLPSQQAAHAEAQAGAVAGIERLPRALPSPRHGHRRGRWSWKRRLVWLVPAAALLIVGWLGARSVWRRGPEVTITFATAEGLEANKTAIKYKSVDIGVIRRIELCADRSGVVVSAELTRQMEDLLVDDARFWVVRPRVSAGGVSGIGTLLTGAHIGFDAGRSAEARRAFVGLEAPPSTVSDRRGRRFTLRADSIGSLDAGSPVYLRRFQVGQVTSVALDARGDAVVELFVDAPHDRQVTRAARFWNASGFDITLGANGLKLDTQSLASVLVGGIAFQAPTDAPDQAPADEGAEFPLHPDRNAALRHPGSPDNVYVLVFDHAVRGVAPGAPVEMAGLDMGEVLAVDVLLEPAPGGGRRPRTRVSVSLYPERLVDEGSGESWRTVLDRLVGQGLRAQARTESLITGRRYVALELVAGARRARLDWERRPLQLPTAAGDPDDVPAAVGRLVAKLDKLPVEELAREGTLALGDMRRTFADTSRLLNRVDSELAPQMVSLVSQARRTLGSVEATLSEEAPLQQDLRGALRDLGAAGQALRSTAEYLERHPESLIRGKKEDRPW